MQPHYDPDHGSRAQDFEIPVGEYGARFAARESLAGVRPEFSGVLMAPKWDANGRQFVWKPVSISSMAELRAFHESSLGKMKRAVEAVGDPFGSDYSVTNATQGAFSQIDTEYVPLLSGPFNKQLYIYDYLLMHSRAFEMVNHAALAAAAVKIMTRFTVGRGLTFHVKDPQCQQIWDEFWTRNKMKERVRQLARDLPWQGELMAKYTERSRGFLTFRPVDPSTCWEVVTDPEDLEHVYYYHFAWPAPYQNWTTGKIPVSQYIVQQIPPTNIQHLKINISSSEKRGRSDLLPVMPWIKRFNDFFNGQTVKAVLEANLVYKIKVMGDQADIDNIMNDPRFAVLPPPGGMFFENDAISLTPISASMTGSRGSNGIGEQLSAIVAVALNMPTDYLGISSSSGGRGSSLIRTDPIVKAVEERQQLFTEMVEEMYDRVLAVAIDEGRIDPSKARHDPEVLPASRADDTRSLSGRPSPRRMLISAREVAE